MKTQIDIITGFLGSGKTAFINGLLQSDMLSDERIVILQCETGEEEIENSLADHEKIHIERISDEKRVDSVYIKGIIKKYLPHRIIIEHNGMAALEELLVRLEDYKLSKTCRINAIIHIIDSSTFDVFMNNMGPLLIEQLSSSDLIIINNREALSRHKITRMAGTLEAINKSVRILSISSPEEYRLAVDHGAVYPEKTKLFSRPSDKLFLVLFLLVAVYFLYTVSRAFRQANIDLSGLQAFNTVFLSILIQAFPFIFIGVFVSSILQVFVSEETVVKFFPRNRIAAFGVAVISGVLFPVCDCAIVPVVGRLVRKGVPLPAAITFMLAAPIVNPIVIASTFYAFPGQPSMVFYRTILGVTIAITVGLTFAFFPQKNSVLLGGMDRFACKCGFCGNRYGSGRGFIGKIDAICMHAASEFFDVGRFLVMGAFISTLMLTLIPKDVFANLGGEHTIALLVMMSAAFIFSICSTSDAFIARTYINQFSPGSIMGFLVLGPMFDVKNLLMLLGSFKKGFVVKLVFVIFGVSFALLYALTPILF